MLNFITIENVKTLIEIFAFVSAGLFFSYKFLGGYFTTNLSISLSCLRQPSKNTGKDYLIVEAKLSKGENGTVSLHDAQVKVDWENSELINPLLGINRKSYISSKLGKIDKKSINLHQRSVSSPFINLSPGEETSFACYFEIPQEAVCTIELTILGKMKRYAIGQWKASAISAPLVSVKSKQVPPLPPTA